MHCICFYMRTPRTLLDGPGHNWNTSSIYDSKLQIYTVKIQGFSKPLRLGTNADVYRLWQRQEEELCAHLHEQPLLPQFLIEDENIWICTDHAGVEVHDPQTLQAPSTRQGHVSLAALKHARQRDFHTVQCHSLKLMKSRLELIGIKGFKIKTSSLIF